MLQLRLQINTRLRASATETGKFPVKSEKSLQDNAMDTTPAASQNTGGTNNPNPGIDEANQSGPEDEEDNGEEMLDGPELLDACDRLEQDNLRLRERLAKVELQRLQRDHEAEEENGKVDSRITEVRYRRLFVVSKVTAVMICGTGHL